MCFSLFEKIFIQGAAERSRGKEKKPAEKATFFAEGCIIFQLGKAKPAESGPALRAERINCWGCS
ncbi:hypothetical protein MR798_05585 [bacterium]|nr:hypothetical protein [bacterium]